MLISKFNEGFGSLLYVVDIYCKYACVINLKDKEGNTITNTFQKISKESNRKPNKIWVDKGSEFYNSSIKSWLEKNDLEMYSAHNEGKSVAAERFIRTSKNKTYKYMTSISKKMYIDKLVDIVNKYNNTYHSTIRIKPVNVKSNTYIDFNKELMKNILNLKLVILIFLQTTMFQIGLRKFSRLTKLKILYRRHAANDFNAEEIVETFYEKKLQKTNQKLFRIKKVIKRKGDKLYAKWKCYDSSFNSWIDKKYKKYKLVNIFKNRNL